MTCEICVVAPIYNENSLVEEFVKQTASVLQQITNNYEIILVDDGSNDSSWKYILNETQKNNKVKGLKLSRNFGHHYAITAGIHNAKSNWVVVMDSDLQDRPEVIKDLFEKANSGYDIVFVNRKNRPEGFFYLLLQKIFYFVLRLLSGIDFDSRQANFSIISNKVVDAFKNFPEQARFYGSTIKWLGFNSTTIEADHGKRFSGRPSYTVKKRLKLASDIILSFSERPLKIAVSIGLLMSVLSLGYFAWIIYGSLTRGFAVLGWPSVMASILFSTGIILIVLGIIGTYIGKIFSEVKSRPLYVLTEKINFEDNN